MTGTYKPGDRVEVLWNGRWCPGTVGRELFNGGKGGYWSVNLDNGSTSATDASRIRRER